MAPRLKEKYLTEIQPALIQEFNFGSVMQAPRLSKVVINIGLGEAVQNPKAVEAAVSDLTVADWPEAGGDTCEEVDRKL